LLIVEDSQLDVELMLDELRQAGFDPKWKRVQTKAEFLIELGNRPDIILSDYAMPPVHRPGSGETFTRTWDEYSVSIDFRNGG
jgi:CheY-like chemotaxis protein